MCLTEKQKRFIDEYLIDLNATQAAIRAGYSEKTARITASENLSKPNIQAEIQKAFQKRAERTQITKDNVLKGIAQLAFSDFRKIATWDEDGKPKFTPSNELDDDTAMSIKSITFTEKRYGKDNVEYNIKVDQYDKQNSLITLAKHLGLLDILKESLKGKLERNEPPQSDFARIRELVGISRTEGLEFGEASNN